jgi:hypothetical protein
MFILISEKLRLILFHILIILKKAVPGKEIRKKEKLSKELVTGNSAGKEIK